MQALNHSLPGQAEEYYGATRTRVIYERAIEALPDDKVLFGCCVELSCLSCATLSASSFKYLRRGLAGGVRNGKNRCLVAKVTQPICCPSTPQLKDISLKFAEMERKLGEIDRARAIFMYASQFCDPRVVVSLWREWHKFEVQHGNEETFREMLRVKRSVQVAPPAMLLEDVNPSVLGVPFGLLS